MRLAWYVNRLRSMSPAEVVHRLAERLKRRQSRGRHEGWARYADGPAPRPLPGLTDRILNASAAERSLIADAAAKTLAGEFSALGQTWPRRDPHDLFPPDLWSRDPVTGTQWPGADTWCFDIEYRHAPGRGDIKYAWELNRLQFLVPLAAHARLTGSGEAADAVAAAIDSWHAANPPFRGIGWSSGIEVALRAISLMLVLTLLDDALPAPTRARIGEILNASAFWLPRFPSRFSSANNHLVAELAGEVLLGIALGQPQRRARAALEAEVLRQILPDGIGAEQTPTYAAFTAELALLVATVAAADGTPLAPEALERLVGFAEFVRWLGTPVPALGDDDEGRVVTTGDEPDYVCSVAAAIAAVTGTAGPELAPDLRGLIFGHPGKIATPPKGTKTFADGGLTIVSRRFGPRQAQLTFDHGPLGYLSIAAHGHADALAVTLSLDSRPVLVDPGTYLYGSGGIWRDWFRSTPAHNTLNIDGQSQGVMSGAFNWSQKPVARLDEAGRPPETWWRASHDGWQSRFGVLHQRTVQIDGNRIALTDQLLPESRAAELVFQLAPGLEARRDGTEIRIFDGDEPLLRLDLPAQQPAEIAIAAGGEAPGDGGWVAPGFGRRQPAQRITWRGEIGPGAVTTWLTPFSNASQASRPLDTASRQT
ncbi:heparinase II/III family protein [Devosia sp.]|uniref:heparinase II/III family protein n=1 Tax=Devosia sp. TaxID=1871048 RepID=UPI003A8D68A6